MTRTCLALGLFSLALTACGGDVPFELVFPSSETFLISTGASVIVYEPNEDVTADEICRNLSASLPAGLANVASTGDLDVCAFASEEGVQINSVPTGRLVFFAEVVGGPDRAPILKGCTVADVYSDTTDIVSIQLSTLPSYPDDPQVLCSDTDAKCVDLQTCIEEN